MSSVYGPLSTHFNYITYIALANSVDYLQLLKAHREKGWSATSHKFKEFRYLLNCVESLNNVPEYLYHDTRSEESTVTFSEFRDRLYSPRSFLEEIGNMANAYKHCVRGRRGERGEFVPAEAALNARDLQSTKMDVQLEVSPTGQLVGEIEYSFEGTDGEEMVGEAFRFWVKYKNREFGIDVERAGRGLDPVIQRASH